MDPVLQELLIGLAGNGLTEFVGRRIDGGAPPVSDDAVKTAIESAVDQLTDVEAILPSLGGEQLREFLQSAEAHNVVRQIFASTAGDKQFVDIECEFYELWRVRTNGATGASRTDLNRLFQVLADLCRRSLDEAIAAGNLTAVDAKATQRHAELRGALGSLERALGMFASSPALNLAEIDDYAVKYRRQLAAREGTITPPALDSARQVPIDSLYVPAQIEEIDASPPQAVAYGEFAHTLFRRVVLGNPGSGKSTLAKKLAADLARDRLVLGQRPGGMVPFLVVLRDFGAHKRDDPCSIVDFIASTSNSRYQLTPPEAAIEYLLLTNRAMVIFDGLDELLDTSYRAEISGDVESFANLYPSVPILVTSREVGYQQAPLSPATFAPYRLAAFSDEKVWEYARNWFAIDDKGLPVEAEDQAAAFMTDSASVSDLRSNALMLGLMCNLYKGSGYIPRNRPDVYEACAEMLFDRWDRLRQIGKPLGIESLLRPTMQHLAAWIYADGELQSGVTEKDLITTAGAFLLDRRFETKEDAELEASRFIEFCRGRAWVFTDTGTTPSGNRLYQFTHRTFLEFFTAGHLVRTNPSPEKLLEVLEPHISGREWDVVAQLAFQLLEHNMDGAADTLLSMLSDGEVDAEDEAQANRLDFAVRSLEFLVPSPIVTKALVEKSLAHLMQFCAATKPVVQEGGTVGDTDRRVEMVFSLIGANPENAKPIEDAFLECTDRYLSDLDVRAYAAELVLNLTLHNRFRRSYDEDRVAESIGTRALDDFGDKLREVAKSDPWIGSDLVLRDALSPEQLLADHGFEPFLGSRSFRLLVGTQRYPVGELMLWPILWEVPGGITLGSSLEALTSLTPRLISNARQPFGSSGSSHAHWLSSQNLGWPRRNLKVDDLSIDQRYSFVALAAMFSNGNPERGSIATEGNPPPETETGEMPLWDAVLPILESCWRKPDVSAVLEAFDRLELNDEQRAALSRQLHIPT